MISHTYKCIFIHIHKTAGTSIEKKLGHFKHLHRGAQDHRTIQQIEPESNLELGKDFWQGARKQSVREMGRAVKKWVFPPIGSSQYQEYFKFTVVRNSWARIYSLYKGVMRDEQHQKDLRIKNEISLYDFLAQYKYQWGLKTQLQYIINKKGEIPLDYIARFENIENEFEYIGKKIGLEDSILPKLLVSKNRPYHEFYDERTKDLVFHLYKKEIKKFNFEFGQ